MTLLVLGLLLFIGMHLLPSMDGIRQGLIARIGPGPYKGLFTIVSLAGLALIVIGKAYAPFVPVWDPPSWTRHLVLSAMPVALMLLTAAYLPSNVKRFTPHPMLWGVTIWAAAHLSANGDLASMLLFGSFLAFALFDIASANARGAQRSTIQYAGTRDLAVIGIGVLAYGVLLFLHPYLFRVPALA